MMIKLGAHMSISGGLENAIKIGAKIDCQTIQIFTKNNNQWRAKPITKDQSNTFSLWQSKVGITPIFAHASYLINIGSPDTALYKKSTDALYEELHRCKQLKLAFLVLHPGAHRNSGEEAALKKVSEAINTVFKKTKGHKTRLLLENTAGQGTYLGHTFEHLAEIIGRVKEKDRVGICFDTCHAFAAGYDMRTKEGYDLTFNHFDKTVGLSKLKAFHLNDSKRPFHSRVDRHEHIGKGYLGINMFKYLMNDKRFEKIPMVLETPKGKECLEDKENLKILRNLIQ